MSASPAYGFEASFAADSVKPTAPGGLRFGVACAPDGAVEWLLKRNCSIGPSQLLMAYGGLCVPSLAVAGFWWVQGARYVMPFAWFELLVVGMALLIAARHAGDRERIALRDGRLTVERMDGRDVSRFEFPQAWVRVAPRRGNGSLIELSSRGERVTIGRHVRPELRPMLADELRSVLRQTS